MPMIHHDDRSYDVAVQDVVKHFQQKLEERIHANQSRVAAVVKQVENDIPADRLIKGSALRFNPTTNGISIELPEAYAEKDDTPVGPLAIHEHAFYQIADRTGLKHAASFLRDAKARGYNEQVADFLTARYQKGNGDRYLLRAVRGEVRGFLSDSFRRLDTHPLLVAFVNAFKKFKAMPYDGFALDTKITLRAVIPIVYQPYPGEVMIFGAQLSDSDFGDGALSLSMFAERCVCTNLATLQDILRQIHLGRRMTDAVFFSQKTLELDTATMASAITDSVQHVLSQGAIDNYCGLIKKAAEEKIEPAQITKWAKQQLNKGETEKAIEKFNSPDVELLPPGQTKWRWSNALSWLANETEDEHRKLELQEFAGTILK